MVGQMKVRSFPTVTLKGMVFVWMGEGEPVDPREDIPPEMFEPNNIFRPTFYMIPCNWVLCLENTLDSHNAFFTHRDAVNILFGSGRLGGRARTPFGYRAVIVNNKVVHYRQSDGKPPVDRYYYDREGNIPYQMYYPGVKGVWPLHRWRLMWAWIWDRSREQARKNRTGWYKDSAQRMDDWNGTRLPGMSRTMGAQDTFRSTRWPVPVEKDLTRMVYLNVERYETSPDALARLKSAVTWPVRDWALNFNFRNQDIWAEMYGQYDQPEYLSSTDSVVIAMRKLFTEHARGIRAPEPEVVAEEVGETMVREGSRRAVQAARGDYAEEIREKLLERA
jgi:hypothetical protein